ncbi:unnamed protein product [Linum trigynum]|uniref:Glycosyltransferase n=1 Tax=Linum trigynum TaxID=586398 RepID=A0AAV2FY41_9ROSI
MAPQLVLIPSPGIGHLVGMVELAKLLIHRYHHLSVVLLAIKSRSTTSKSHDYINSISVAGQHSTRLSITQLPNNDDPSDPNPTYVSFVESKKPQVKDAVSRLISTGQQLAGFVLDMFCTSMIDIADEHGLPSYIFYPSSAASLAFTFHIQAKFDHQGLDLTKSTESELSVPFFAKPLPRKVVPPAVMNEEWLSIILDHGRNFRRARGILVNTIREMESHSLESLTEMEIPKVYPVGPILNLDGGGASESSTAEILRWLDGQPDSSVVFLCFGSLGTFGADQVREIAIALEKSGERFLWSLRKGAPEGVRAHPTDYDDVGEVLPEGFLDRTATVGKVIGWAPQAAVLAHKATGGFVSHCGWNSTMESVWFGVPMAAWPMYAEQQFTAFELVEEVGMAVEIRMDYVMGSSGVVAAGEIEGGIRRLMEQGSEMRRKVKELSVASKELSGGIAEFVHEVVGDV